MIMLFIILIASTQSHAQSTDSPPTDSPSSTSASVTSTTTPIPKFYQLGFIVGMSIMGALILAITLFMIITACQRAHKKKSKKPAAKKEDTKPNNGGSGENNVRNTLSDPESIVVDIGENVNEKMIGGDGGPF